METLIASAIVILFAYFARGITGFGSGLIAVPLLAHLHALTFVVPLILITDVTASLVMGAGRGAPSAGGKSDACCPAA